MLKCFKHKYGEYEIPSFEVKGGELVALFTPIVGLDNLKFFTQNSHIRLWGGIYPVPLFVSTKKIKKYNISHDLTFYTRVKELKEKIVFGHSSVLDIILLNFFLNYDSYSNFILFTAGLGDDKLGVLYKTLFEIISMDRSKCGIIIENSVNGLFIAEVKPVTVTGDFIRKLH